MIASLGVLLWIDGTVALAKRPAAEAPRTPSVEEVVASEGFTPTPSQSDIYRPGAVLLPNDRGSHDVVASSCVATEPETSFMSQSSIASTLATGVSARFALGSAGASAGVEKRLSFVDPEQRTIALGDLTPTEDCRARVARAAQLQDLSGAMVVYDVMVAMIKSSVCTRADASGQAVVLGAAEASAFSECVRESETQVPLGYKAVPLDRVLQLAAPAAAASVGGATGGAVSASADFSTGPIGVEAMLAEQACTTAAEAEGAARREQQLRDAMDEAARGAAAAWAKISGELEACTALPTADRAPCVAAAEAWLDQARSLQVRLTAGVESIETECGARQAAFPAAQRAVVVAQLAAAESLVARLSAPDAAALSAGSAGAYTMAPVRAGRFELGCDADDRACEPDEQPHTVTLTRPVLVGTHEVSQGLYAEVMGQNPAYFTQCGPDCPVEQISWIDAVRFANALSQSEGLELCYTITADTVRWPRGLDCSGYRLPTEAEWEVAARAGSSDPFSGSDRATDVGWTGADSGGGPHPVGARLANAHGLYDMTGNVGEWVWDWYGVYAPKSTDPMGPEEGEARGVRGGSWFSQAAQARVTDRDWQPPDFAGFQVGLRLVRTARDGS